MKVKQKKSALLPGLITVLMVVAAVAGGLRMTDPDGGRLDTMRQELETITAENEGLTAQVEACVPRPRSRRLCRRRYKSRRTRASGCWESWSGR